MKLNDKEIIEALEQGKTIFSEDTMNYLQLNPYSEHNLLMTDDTYNGQYLTLDDLKTTDWEVIEDD